MELIIDSFAGGGGASTGIEMALGRSPDYAINHDEEALALHAANHPDTIHLSKNIYKVDPMDVVDTRPVGLLWASPDCKHFSKAKGGKPVRRDIRDLAWTVVLWAQRAKPRVIILENVEEFQGWGPLITMPNGDLMPCPDRRGETFKDWIKALKKEGYKVEWRELRACDYGAPTTRKRLFLIARRDGRKIVWPAPTHGAPTDGDVISGKKSPWRTAANDVIDWSIPCPSIFDTSQEIMAKFGVRAVRPLAENTMARIAKGVKRYVLDAVKPFIVDVAHSSQSASGVKRWGSGVHDADKPMGTISAGGIQQGIVTPHLMTMRNAEKPHNEVDKPSHTVTAGGAGLSLVAPIIVKSNHGDKPHYSADEPTRTIVAGGTHHALVSPVLTGVGGRAGQSRPRSADEPTATTTTKADTVVVVPILSSAQHGGSLRGGDEPHRTIAASDKDQNQIIAAHLSAYYGPGDGSDDRSSDVEEPIRTVVTENRHAVIAATMVQTGYGERDGQEPRALDVEKPLGTVVAGGVKHAVVAAHIDRQFGGSVGHGADEPLATITANGGGKAAVVAAFLAQHNTGMVGHHTEEPVSTIVQKGCTPAVVSAGLMNMKGSDRRMSDIEDPTPVITSQGNHIAEVRAFLLKYYGNENDPQDIANPMATVTTRDRFGIVTVEGEPYHIIDIGMRMLTPRELFKAQGFPGDYEIETGRFTVINRENGKEWITYEFKPLTKTAQVRMCGNSVCPPIAAALVAANCMDMAAVSRIAAE